jgi:putative transposase
MNTDVDVPSRGTDRQETFWTWIDDRVRQLVIDLAEQMLKFQMQVHLTAGWNERTEARRGYRNGHYRRRLSTPHGPLEVKIPRCREGGLDCSVVFDRYQRRIADVDRILRHAYLLGASTRGTAELAEQVFGGTLSHQTVSKLMRWLDDQLALWRTQPIAAVYKVVYIDGMHVDVVGGDRMVMLAAGQGDDGKLDVLGFCVSRGEQCAELLWDMRRRGLEGVELFVSDESGAIRSGLEQVYPEVRWQSCAFHRLSALRANVGPTNYRNLMTAEAACIFRCPSKLAAEDAAAAWAKRWKPLSPWAVQQFVDDLEDTLMFYNLPSAWWKRVRTNNPLERLIRTLRMRLRQMGCFHDQPAIQRAVFGQLARWHKIKLTHNT